jgi:hypothetical protein
VDFFGELPTHRGGVSAFGGRDARGREGVVHVMWHRPPPPSACGPTLAGRQCHYPRFMF